mmetsp:Transcript_18185/g.41064  ORF Transcript_18185/g.41064 Transcript_18185/m.41064 type:complete len:245 (+) Transcript_18185:556-1290(+)
MWQGPFGDVGNGPARGLGGRAPHYRHGCDAGVPPDPHPVLHSLGIAHAHHRHRHSLGHVCRLSVSCCPTLPDLTPDRPLALCPVWRQQAGEAHPPGMDGHAPGACLPGHCRRAGQADRGAEDGNRRVEPWADDRASQQPPVDAFDGWELPDRVRQQAWAQAEASLFRMPRHKIGHPLQRGNLQAARYQRLGDRPIRRQVASRGPVGQGLPMARELPHPRAHCHRWNREGRPIAPRRPRRPARGR